MDPDEIQEQAPEIEIATEEAPPEAIGETVDGEEEAIIAFADETGEPEEETPLIRKLREQIRTLSRKAAAPRPETNNDPEPVVIPRKTVEDFDYDNEKWNEYDDARQKSIEDHAEWKVRQAQRETEAKAREESQARQIEQQRKALGVTDYEARAAEVKDALTDQQLAILVSAADNPAQLIYALGKSQSKLSLLSAEDNLARFAAMVGKFERDVKVTKRKAPDPERVVRGATAPTAMLDADKHLERLEREAERTGDRSQVIAYRRSLRQKQAA